MACRVVVWTLAVGVWCMASVWGRSITGSRSLLGSCDSSSFNELKPSKIDARPSAVRWVGDDDKYVFIITSRNTLWRSKDGGSSFEEITSKLQSSMIKDTEPVLIVNIIASKANPGSLIFQGAGTYLWLSKDYGETFTALRTPTRWKGEHADLRQHPTEDGWILAMVKRPNCTAMDMFSMKCPNDLLMTKDAFSTMKWVNLTESAEGKIAGFVDFDWASLLCKDADCSQVKLTTDSIFATIYRHPGDWDRPWDPDVHYVRSDDYFKSTPHVVQCGNQFELVGSSIYLAVANSCPVDIDGKAKKGRSEFPQGISLYTSVDGGKTFTQACLPVAMQQEGYELLELQGGKGTIAIVDYEVKTSMGNVPASSVYTAGPNQALFSLSLRNIYRQETSSVSSDFTKIEGLPGVFIANEILPRPMGAVMDMMDMMEPLVVTRISFNGGGEWQPIAVPNKVNNAKCDRCNGRPDCSLHLYGNSAWLLGSLQVPSVYSHASAPGFIFGTGNIASQDEGLDMEDLTGMCTWMSVDGGVTWQDIGVGAHIYEFADWGGVMIMAPHVLHGPTQVVKFSVDYGSCWYEVPLDTAMLVDNIRIEPDGQRPRVLVHGRECRKDMDPKCSREATEPTSALQGLVYVVDVEELLGAKMEVCKASKDFELWTVPSPTHTPRCVLGQTMQYTRRKQNSPCRQGADYKRPPAVNTTCACTISDFECDYGYMKENDVCKPIPAERMPRCPRLEERQYVISKTGLRLVQGEVCTNPETIVPDTDGHGKARPGHKPTPAPTPAPAPAPAPAPTPAPTPAEPSSKGHSGTGDANPPAKKDARSAGWGFFMFLLVVGSVSGLVYVWWRYLASEGAKAMLEDVWYTCTGCVTSLWGWMMDKVSGRSGYARGYYNENELNYFQPLGDPSNNEPAEQGGGVFTLR